MRMPLVLRRLPALLALAVGFLASSAAAAPLLLTGLEGAAICFLDDEVPGAYNPGERVYFDRGGCANVSNGDVRLSEPGFGERVRSTDTDSGAPDTAPPLLPSPPVRYYDNDGDGVWSAGDTAYLKLTGGTTLAVGDVRLTPFQDLPAGSVVSGGDPDGNSGVADVPNAVPGTDWKYVDNDGDGIFTAGDDLYIDTNADDLTTVGDIRIAATAAPPPPPPPPPPEEEEPADEGDPELEAQLRQLVAQNTALAGQLNQSLTQNAQLAAQVSNLSGQLAQQSQQLTTLNSQLTQVQQDNARLRGEIAGNQTSPGRGTPAPGVAVAALALALAALRRRA